MVPPYLPLEGSGQIFVLDTNVLLYDPASIFVFKHHEVVIPITVIEEIDRFKKDLNETGRNARQVSRHLDALRSKGSLSEGVELPEGGSLRVELPHTQAELPNVFGPLTNDNIILSTAKYLHDTSRNKSGVVLVTRDTNMRVKADALGLPAEDYEHAHLEIEERYMGASNMTVTAAMIDEVYERGWSPWEKPGLYANQFLILNAEDREGQSAMVRFDARQNRLTRVGRHKEGVWGIFARNKEQLFALDLLLDDSVSLVTLDGVAGTGKTLLAIAAGLKKATDDRVYRKLLVSRPVYPLGRDVGFLPGDLEEKLNPWMKPIYDNLELLISGAEGDSRRERQERTPAYQPLLDQGIIEVEPLTYIRGRSIPRQYLIVDEAQNLTPHEVKTVVTRAGEGTKVILTGDPLQIDNPYVDATSNGLTYVIENMKESPLAGHVTLRKGERSELAEVAAELL